MQETESFKEYLRERQTEKGTYVGWRYGDDTLHEINTWLSDSYIPNPIHITKIHSTIIYSRVEFDFEPKGRFIVPEYAQTNRLGTFDTRDGKRALIWFIDCQAMTDRHNHIMKTTAATFDYDEYTPHITLSYDIPADYDISKLHIQGLPIVLQLVSEYTEELDLDWA